MLTFVLGCGSQTQQSGVAAKGSLCEGVEEAMLLLSIVDIREVTGRAFICKPRLELNVVIASDEGS